MSYSEPASCKAEPEELMVGCGGPPVTAALPRGNDIHTTDN